MRIIAAIVALSLYLASCVCGCGGSQPPALAVDVAKIELADAVCLAKNIQLPDDQLVMKCSPSGDPAKVLQMAVYVSYCRLGYVPGSGDDGGTE